ncbi:MAG: long-chain fatty acid--CoA ligase [Bacteroidota bacterium]|nr:long-chain fatty acid--CoA ligase [Bacteroidota bacterium]
MELTRVFDILDNLKLNSSKTDILSSKELLPKGKSGKNWFNHSVTDFVTNVNHISSGLLALGLEKKDTVAIMSNNQPEWNFVDFAAQQVAMPSVPIFPTVGADDLKFILSHSEAKAIFISDKGIYTKLQLIQKDLPNLKHIYSFNRIEGVKHLSELIELGKKNYDQAYIDAIKASVSENDLFTILYTSGTTGQPKGVMISHKGIMSNVKALQALAPIASDWKALSFLPLNHVYERVLVNLYLFKGVSVYYAENFETIAENAKDIQPQIFVSVPRIFERVIEKFYAAGDKLTGFKKKIFDLSIKLAERYELHGANGAWYEFQRKICDRLVYSKWRAAFGGKLVCIVSGGAALNSRIERVFSCAKITLLQGYGMTETSVVIAANCFGEDNIKFGTVGPVLSGVTVKIAEEDGEILMKGPNLMMGYYKNLEATAEAIDANGWFHTGDVGILVANKFLKITDRKKELFKTSAGKYISPVAIENKLKECKFIEQCMVIGEGQKFASAIIIPNISNFKEHCKANNIEWLSNELMIECDEINKLINDHVKEINKTHAPYEHLKRCKLVGGQWSVEGGEITPKLSLKRKVIKEKNKLVIDAIFGSDDE